MSQIDLQPDAPNVPGHTHGHHHHAHHTPGSETYESANKDHFDATAHTYDERPDAQRRAEEIGRAMRQTGLVRQGLTTVMDFACGTGLISRALAAEDPKSIIGVDISQAMVDRYNQTVDNHGIPSSEMHAVCVAPDANLKNALENMGITPSFDVIVCASSYHHFSSIDAITQSLAACLKLGGSLLVADLVHSAATHEIFPDDVHHIVAHKGGFTEADIRSAFNTAGLKLVSFNVIAQAMRAKHAVDLFLARGDKL